MSLQNSITRAMSEVTKEIIATNNTNSENQKRLEILKASIDKVVSLSPSDIVMQNNVRHNIDTESSDFRQLCESIQRFGLMKNIVAELKINDDGETYSLICVAGHRRLTALKTLGITSKIPCLIKQYKSGDRIGAALSENIIREDLNCIDIANGYSDLKTFGWSDDDLVRHFEKNKKTIALYLRLAELPEDIKNLIRENQDKLPFRVLSQNVLSKNKAHGDIRKAINRRLKTEAPIKKDNKQERILAKLEEFFTQEGMQGATKENVISALKFVGVLK